MILTKYNEELHAKTLIEEGRREEREKNAQILQNNIKFLRQLLLQNLALKGLSSARITERIQAEDNPDTLQAWASFAVSCGCAEALEKKILEDASCSEG